MLEGGKEIVGGALDAAYHAQGGGVAVEVARYESLQDVCCETLLAGVIEEGALAQQ